MVATRRSVHAREVSGGRFRVPRSARSSSFRRTALLVREAFLLSQLVGGILDARHARRGRSRGTWRPRLNGCDLDAFSGNDGLRNW